MASDYYPLPGFTRFKLHLRPTIKREPGLATQNTIPPLPLGKDIVSVFSDFFRYLFECAKTFILESHQMGIAFWQSLGNQTEFILSHPNGWEGEQQGKMREAAVRAGLVPNTDEGHGRVHFVTEGEASLHFCIHHGLSTHIRVGGGLFYMWVSPDFFNRKTRPSSLLMREAGLWISARILARLQTALMLSPSKRLLRLNVSSSRIASILQFLTCTSVLGHFTGSTFVTKNAKRYLEGESYSMFPEWSMVNNLF